MSFPLEGEPFIIPAPVPLYITERTPGAYHGGDDWPADRPRQEPATHQRIRVVALAYKEWPRYTFSGTLHPIAVMTEDGTWQQPFTLGTGSRCDRHTGQVWPET